MPGGICPPLRSSWRRPCPCKFVGAGAAILTAGAYAALPGCAPVLLGANFSALLVATISTPLAPPLAAAAWGGVMLSGLVLLARGLYAAIINNDEIPHLGAWLAAVAVAFVCLYEGWTPPREWGAVCVMGSRALAWSAISAGAVNLVLAFRRRCWINGFETAQHRLTGNRIDPRDAIILQQNAALVDLSAERDRLTRELAQPRPPAGELREFVGLLGGSRVILGWRHPDRAEGEAAKRHATENFKEIANFLGRHGLK